jgi:hypothetical protein
MTSPIISENLQTGFATGEESASDVCLFRVAECLNVHVDFNEIILAKPVSALKEVACMDRC